MTSSLSNQVDDQMVVLDHYYPGIYTQVVPEQGTEVKPRRRRTKTKEETGSSGFRKRKLTDEQAKMLELHFGNEHKLESERKDRLASELGLDPRQVAVWFQNRRARWKSKKLEEEYSRLKGEYECSVAEKCQLKTETEEHLAEEKVMFSGEKDENQQAVVLSTIIVEFFPVETLPLSLTANVLKLKERLSEIQKEMQKLLEQSNGGSSNSPSSSFSAEVMEPPFLGGFGMEGLENVFCVPEESYDTYGLEYWPNLYDV